MSEHDRRDGAPRTGAGQEKGIVPAGRAGAGDTSPAGCTVPDTEGICPICGAAYEWEKAHQICPRCRIPQSCCN